MNFIINSTNERFKQPKGDCKGPVSKPGYYDTDLSNARRRLLNSALARSPGCRGHRQWIAVKRRRTLETKALRRSKAIEPLLNSRGAPGGSARPPRRG